MYYTLNEKIMNYFAICCIFLSYTLQQHYCDFALCPKWYWLWLEVNVYFLVCRPHSNSKLCRKSVILAMQMRYTTVLYIHTQQLSSSAHSLHAALVHTVIQLNSQYNIVLYFPRGSFFNEDSIKWNFRICILYTSDASD